MKVKTRRLLYICLLELIVIVLLTTMLIHYKLQKPVQKPETAFKKYLDMVCFKDGVGCGYDVFMKEDEVIFFITPFKNNTLIPTEVIEMHCFPSVKRCFLYSIWKKDKIYFLPMEKFLTKTEREIEEFEDVIMAESLVVADLQKAVEENTKKIENIKKITIEDLERLP